MNHLDRLAWLIFVVILGIAVTLGLYIGFVA